MLLQTERLILRPWEEADAEDLYTLARDPDVGPIAGWPAHRSAEESLSVIRFAFTGKECYAVCRKEDGRAIGCIELKLNGHTDMTEREDECELGYWIGRPFWGRGYVTEAARELIRHGFTALKMRSIWCGYYEGNERSKHVQEKLGFRYHHVCSDVDVPLMHETRTGHTNLLTREDWLSRFTLQKLADERIPEALDLIRRVFTEYEAPEYPPEGVEEFRKSLNDDTYLAGIAFYGVCDGERLIAALGIRTNVGHICFAFTDSRYQRLGIGTRLFDTIKEEYAGKTLTLNSSPYGLPFYRALGFTATDTEQTVNGIRFTPMVLYGTAQREVIVKLSARRDLKGKAAAWFAGKWRVPEEAYLESIEQSFSAKVPAWYLCMDGGTIAAGAGVIENDFHDRKDLTPNVCAVYTEPAYRSRGIAGRLLAFICEDMHASGTDTLYLLTDHTGFYERYGWEFFCMAQGDGEEELSRMYVHRYGTGGEASEAES